MWVKLSITTTVSKKTKVISTTQEFKIMKVTVLLHILFMSCFPAFHALWWTDRKSNSAKVFNALTWNWSSKSLHTSKDTGGIYNPSEPCKPGAHCLTLDKLYDAEQKLYKEVKVIQISIKSIFFYEGSILWCKVCQWLFNIHMLYDSKNMYALFFCAFNFWRRKRLPNQSMRKDHKCCKS